MYFICRLQITWSRLEDDARPYSLLTIGEENYVEDKRFLVVTTQKGLTDVSTGDSRFSEFFNQRQNIH